MKNILYQTPVEQVPGLVFLEWAFCVLDKRLHGDGSIFLGQSC